MSLAREESFLFQWLIGDSFPTFSASAFRILDTFFIFHLVSIFLLGMSVRYYPIDFPSCFDPSQTRLIPDRTDQGWFCRRNAINARLCEADPISVSCLRVYNNERRFLGTTHGELCPLFLFLYINHNDLVSLGAGTLNCLRLAGPVYWDQSLHGHTSPWPLWARW